MIRPRRNTRLLGLVSALCAFIVAPAAHAQLVTLSPVMLSNGLYHYDYSIANNTASDLFDLDINVAPGLNTVQNLTAPAGFMATNDTGLGIVDFLEDTSSFTAVPLSGFAFDSPLPPQSSTFDANLADPNSNITVVSGQVIAPQVPEPGTLALALLAAPGLLLTVRRRRTTPTSDRSTQGDHTV